MMKTCILLLTLAALLPAQQPTIDNAKLETRALSGTLTAAISQLGPGPFWAGWSEPIVPGQHNDVCSWNYTSDRMNGYGRTPGVPVRLEGEIALVLLVRVENGQVGELRVVLARLSSRWGRASLLLV